MKEADRFKVRFRPIVVAYLLSSTRLALGYLLTYVWCVLLDFNVQRLHSYCFLTVSSPHSFILEFIGLHLLGHLLTLKVSDVHQLRFPFLTVDNSMIVQTRVLFSLSNEDMSSSCIGSS